MNQSYNPFDCTLVSHTVRRLLNFSSNSDELLQSTRPAYRVSPTCWPKTSRINKFLVSVVMPRLANSFSKFFRAWMKHLSEVAQGKFLLLITVSDLTSKSSQTKLYLTTQPTQRVKKFVLFCFVSIFQFYIRFEIRISFETGVEKQNKTMVNRILLNEDFWFSWIG